MFGSLGNMAEMLKKAKSLQENMQKMQNELAEKRFEADAGAGMVRAQVNGKGDLIQVKIDPEALHDVELIEDLVVAAVGAAIKKAQEAAKAEMAQLTGGLNLPGLTDMLGQGS
jgi:DNA-binding YbaB/EbfC family protein